MSQPTLLRQLQEIDDQIRDGKVRLTKVIQALNEPQALLDAREAAASAETQLSKCRATQRDLELQFGTVSSKHKASHDRMYSGKVTSSRELSDLQMEVESLVRRRDQLEEQALEAMMETEESAEQKEQADATLVQLEAAWKQQSAELNDEKLKLATSINGLIQKRKTHAARIDVKLLKTYLGLAKKGRGTAVGVYQNQKCSACRMPQSMSTVKTVAEGHVAYCESCRRLLVAA